METLITLFPTLVTAVVLTTLTLAPEAAYRFAQESRRRIAELRRTLRRREPEAPRRVVRTYGRSWCE
ncbi:hypothetical protein [Deferrisoma camini]|uniref:hypothetical protein n=1 Tax=Deferrisoma camini TaxID=1035120 RepID=UPI00046D4DEF|nr:hypothetical protein [Deferrisoma camini]